MALSFQRVDLFGGGRFVGLDNYARLFADADRSSQSIAQHLRCWR